MVKVKKSHKIIGTSVLCLFVVILAVATMFFLGDRYALTHLSFKSASPDQIASAMQGDYYYSNYRENTLFVGGSVKSNIMSGDHYIVQFDTTTNYSVFCDFGANNYQLNKGDKIEILTEGPDAIRQPSSVLLKSCVLLS